MKYSKYNHSMMPQDKLAKRIESDFIPVLGGHLVLEERAFFAAGIVKNSGQELNYGSLHLHTLTKDSLLDLKKCIDIALNEFEEIMTNEEREELLKERDKEWSGTNE